LNFQKYISIIIKYFNFHYSVILFNYPIIISLIALKLIFFENFDYFTSLLSLDTVSDSASKETRASITKSSILSCVSSSSRILSQNFSSGNCKLDYCVYFWITFLAFKTHSLTIPSQRCKSSVPPC
jgi:hypothetical protein